MDKGEMKIEINGYASTERTARISGGSGAVGVPKSWIQKRVKVILLDPLEG